MYVYIYIYICQDAYTRVYVFSGCERRRHIFIYGQAKYSAAAYGEWTSKKGKFFRAFINMRVEAPNCKILNGLI